MNTDSHRKRKVFNMHFSANIQKREYLPKLSSFLISVAEKHFSVQKYKCYQCLQDMSASNAINILLPCVLEAE